jgi:hypothetical protein
VSKLNEHIAMLGLIREPKDDGVTKAISIIPGDDITGIQDGFVP